MNIPYFLEAQMKINETCRLLIEEYGLTFRPWGGSIGSVWDLHAGEFSVECDRRSDAFIIWTLSGRYGVESTPVHEDSDPEEVVLDVLRKAGRIPRPKREKASGKPKRSTSFVSALAEWQKDIGTSVQISGRSVYSPYIHPLNPYTHGHSEDTVNLIIQGTSEVSRHIGEVFLQRPGDLRLYEELIAARAAVAEWNYANHTLTWWYDFLLTDVVEARTSDGDRYIQLHGELESYNLGL